MRLALAAGAAGLLLAVSGCTWGSFSVGSSSSGSGAVPASAAGGYTFSVDMFSAARVGGGPAPKTPLELYAVFRRPAAHRDAAAARAVSGDAVAGPRSLTPVPGSARLVLVSHGRQVYAARTAHGVCVGLLPDGGASCGDTSADGALVEGYVSGPHGPLAVYGLVPDGVAGAHFVVGKQRYEAAMGENAYLVRAPRFDSLAAASIVFRWRDGHTTATKLG